MKKWISWMAALLMVTALALPALAAEPQLNHVTDAAGLLTEEEWETLERQAGEISNAYQCDVYIITLEDFTEYTSQSSVYEGAKELYRDYDLGYGTEKSGVLLLLSMAERDYSLIAFGYGNTAFTDYGKDTLAEAFLDDFSSDDWFDGFTDYLQESETMLRAAREGTPVDADSGSSSQGAGILISIALGCLLSFGICAILARNMKSVGIKMEADSYIRDGRVNFTARADQFTHVTQTRVKIEKQSSSGGGGTTEDRSGFSGKSGKF